MIDVVESAISYMGVVEDIWVYTMLLWLQNVFKFRNNTFRAAEVW